jgi:hypothetical protein|tara:strand:+ start:1009 stop:1170 length:162 start_codon:yes stop_codon:yes gene_type:complete
LCFFQKKNKRAADRSRIVAQKSNVAVASQVFIPHFICSFKWLKYRLLLGNLGE